MPPSAQLQLVVQGAGATTLARLSRHDEAIRRLARLSTIGQTTAALPRASLQVVVDDATFALPVGDVIDIAREQARLEKEIGKLDVEVAKARQKLASPAFVERAPAEVVEELRERLAEAAGACASVWLRPWPASPDTRIGASPLVQPLLLRSGRCAGAIGPCGRRCRLEPLARSAGRRPPPLARGFGLQGQGRQRCPAAGRRRRDRGGAGHRRARPALGRCCAARGSARRHLAPGGWRARRAGAWAGRWPPIASTGTRSPIARRRCWRWAKARRWPGPGRWRNRSISPATWSTRRPTIWAPPNWRQRSSRWPASCGASYRAVVGDDLVEARLPADPCRGRWPARAHRG